MAQFLPVPAKDKIVPVAGPDSYRDVQSRKSRFMIKVRNVCFTIKLSRWRAKIVTSLFAYTRLLAKVQIPGSALSRFWF